MKKKKLTQFPKRQKVIPRHFKKRKKATLSEILQAASNTRRMKTLLENNRELATALEESRSKIACNTRMIQEYTLASTQVFMAQRKLKDMASTLQIFVSNLDAALNYLDVSHLTSSTIYSNDVLKTGTCPPDLETIEESPRSSIASNEDELMEDASPAIYQLKMGEKSTPDTSVTEIYNVTNFFTINPEKQNGSQENNVESPTIRTPEMPQFSPPKYTSKMPDFVFEKPKDLDGKEFTKQATSKAKTNSNLSKIPVRRPNLFCDLGIPDSPEALVPSIQRKTFVVNQLNKDNNECSPVSVKPGADTLQELAHELQATQKADSHRRGTFAILPPHKPDPRSGNQSPHEICTGDMTMNSVEDMELTEIIPSGALASSTCEMQYNNFYLPSNKTAGNLKALPSTSNISKPISPIEKYKPSPNLSIVSSDHKPGLSKLKEGKVVSKCFVEGFVPGFSNLKPTDKISKKLIGSNPLNETFKLPTISTPPTLNMESPEYCHKSVGQSVSPIIPEELLKQQKLSINPIIAAENDLDVINESKKSNRASRKSVLPYSSKGFSKQMNQTNDADDLEEVQECQRSKTSRMTVLPNFFKKSSNYRNLSSDHLSEETGLEATDKQNKSSRASRKSLLPNPKELLNQLNLSDNIDAPDTPHVKTTNEVMSLDEITKPSSVCGTEKTVVNREHLKEPEVSNSKSTKKNLKRTSSICSRKSLLPKISENSSSSSFSDMFPSDSEPEVITPVQQRKRIPGRRSLKPGRRGPFIFKKTREFNSKLNKLECADSKGYDFSSSDEDEEPTKKRRQSKKPPKKGSKMPKNKNTVAVLERDIGLMYQEQGRRKRSLKKKVSFANINATPTNSDGEDRVKNSEREIKILDDMFETNDDCEKRSVPVRHSILKKPSLPAEKSYISHDISPNIEHKLKSSFSSTDESEKGLNKNEKYEDIEKQANKVKGRSQGLVNVTDKKMDGQPKERLFAASHVDEIDVNKKSSLNVEQGNSSSKLSSAKSHKNSEFFGFESKRSKSKKTFSGVSERSSRKRVTATDDFLEDVDIPFTEENPNDGAPDIKSLSNATQNTNTSLAKPPIDYLNAENVAVKNETSGADVAPSSSDKKIEAPTVDPKTPVFVNVSSKKSFKAKRNKKTKTPTSSEVLTEVKKNTRKSKSKNVLKENIIDSAFTPPPSKARKTGSTGSLKENLVVPDLESGGRSRRSKPTISFKEPSLNRKMRRN